MKTPNTGWSKNRDANFSGGFKVGDRVKVDMLARVPKHLRYALCCTGQIKRIGGLISVKLDRTINFDPHYILVEEEWIERLGSADSLKESEDLGEQLTLLGDLTGECPSKLMTTPLQSCDCTGETAQSIEISKTSTQSQDNTTSYVGDSLVMEPPALGNERDLNTPTQPYSKSSSDAFASVAHPLYSWNSLKDLSIEDLEHGLEESEWQDIKAALRSTSQLASLERCIREPESLSCPTLLSGSQKGTTRAAGIVECERWWKDNVIRRNGYQLAAWAMALLQGFPMDWFECLSPFPPDIQGELDLGILPGESSVHPKRLLPSEWSSTSLNRDIEIDSIPLEKSRASGWLEKRTKVVKGVTYPKVEGYRDEDNLDHWYWEYRYEEKAENSTSDNGFITRSVYLKGDLKKKIEAIRLAIARKWSVQKILAFIRG